MREGVEREVVGDCRGLRVWNEGVLVEGSDSKQSEMNVQCEQIISTPYPPLHTPKRTYM